MFFFRKSSNNPFENGHEFVDLGLSVKWAKCNIGASSSEQRGDYFAWGEVRTKNRYDWDTYSMCKGSQYTLTEYNTSSHSGRVDDRTELSSSSDVAKAKWGGKWRIPTAGEFTELINRCHWGKCKLGGSQGNVYRIEGPNGNSIILPTTGVQSGNAEIYPMDYGNDGFYWADSIDPQCSYAAFCLGFDFYYDEVRISKDYRCFGHPIRPVCK